MFLWKKNVSLPTPELHKSLCISQVKVAILKYIESLARQMDPTDFVNSSETRLAVSRIITWTTEPKSSDVRKVSQDDEVIVVIIALQEGEKTKQTCHKGNDKFSDQTQKSPDFTYLTVQTKLSIQPTHNSEACLHIFFYFNYYYHTKRDHGLKMCFFLSILEISVGLYFV